MIGKLVLALGLVVGLTACSHKSDDATVAQQIVGKPTDNGTAAQSFASNSQPSITTDSNGFKVNSASAPSNQTYYFGFNESTVRSTDMAALLAQAGYVANHPAARIRLDGYTDNRGSREYNIALGWRRDQAVARLLEQQGVKPKQIQMVSYGKEKPAAFGNTDHDWALNRRVNLIYKVNG